MGRSLEDSLGYWATEGVQMRKIKQNTLVCCLINCLIFSCEGKKFIVSSNNINYPTTAETLQRPMMCLETENVVNHGAWIQGFIYLTPAALSLPHTQGTGRPWHFNQAKAGIGKCAFRSGLCVLENKTNYTEKDGIDASEPTGRVLIQLQPFTLCTHDFSGRYSLKLLQKKNLMSCSKAKRLFPLFIG
jgi:hypothetical protein